MPLFCLGILVVDFRSITLFSASKWIQIQGRIVPPSRGKKNKKITNNLYIKTGLSRQWNIRTLSDASLEKRLRQSVAHMSVPECVEYHSEPN